MISIDGHRAVDLSPRLKARIYRVNGDIEEGNTDPYGKPWVMKEGEFPGDNSLFTLYFAPKGDTEWPHGRQSTHHGSHVQGGGGHISHWPDTPADMKGIWEMPAETFMGEAAVCNLKDLTPQPVSERFEYPIGRAREGDLRGCAIQPEHLANVRIGDIVLLTSPFRDLEQPWLPAETSAWLANDRKIKMLGIGVPGIQWDYNPKAGSPDNSPTRRNLLGANIPIAHPLVNIDTLTKERVYYFGLPLRMAKMEASFIRAIALEETE